MPPTTAPNRIHTTTTANEGSAPEGILYSAGRDGMVSAWNLNLQLNKRPTEYVNGHVAGDIIDDDGRKTALVSEGKSDPARDWDVVGEKIPATEFRTQVQAHTHWVNDILLAHKSTSVISCSSDMTVKFWRPHASEQSIPTTLGSHADYVKCLASPSDDPKWIASGGLDRKIILWDITGKGELHKFEVGDSSETPKGSVYALATGGGILASGGPDTFVRLWDPNAGKRITKFVGHTDNVRSILLSDDGRTMLTASSDTYIKLWSLATRRCLHTFSMHSDSVWTLHSLDPRLEVFHAGDRGGLVTKTDIRNVGDIDEAECVAVYKEHHGVTKIVGVGNRLWSATSSSSINRWLDTPDWDPVPISSSIHHRTGSTSRHRPSTAQSRQSVSTLESQPSIPSQAFLRLTSFHDSLLSVGPLSSKDQDVASVFSAPAPQQTHVPLVQEDPYHIVPVREDPEATIAGQHGLIKHILLNDRRRVLTLDTSHTVALWDIVECKQLQSFGAKDIYEIEKQVNSNENVPNWCTVDTRIGSITVVLDERNAFDAEVYRDEMGLDDESDQRINIGKWVLRYLFANLIETEQQRDEICRQKVEEEAAERRKTAESQRPPGMRISIPPPVHKCMGTGEQTPRGRYDTLMTPGIGLATPAPMYDPSPSRTSIMSPDNDFHTIASSNKDYFTGASFASNGEEAQAPLSPSLPADTPGSPEPAKESSFMGRLKSFGTKKLQKPEKDDTSAQANSNGTDKTDEAEKVEDDANAASAKDTAPYMFSDVLAVIKKTYETALNSELASTMEKFDDNSISSSITKIPVLGDDGRLKSAITPTTAEEAPVIHPTQDTTIIIAEQKVSVDGSMDLYRGTVASVGNDADLLEAIAPGWLAELLLLDKLPKKDIVKISFALKPHASSVLPEMVAGNSRLNANRMLRARKVVSYVGERIESEHIPADTKDQPDTWLEILCQDKVILTYSMADADCTSKMDLADDTDANVETRWRHYIHLSAEMGRK